MQDYVGSTLFVVIISAVLAVQFLAFCAVLYALRLAQRGKVQSKSFDDCTRVVKLCRLLSGAIVIGVVLVEPEAGALAAVAYALWKVLVNPIQSLYVRSQLYTAERIQL